MKAASSSGPPGAQPLLRLLGAGTPEPQYLYRYQAGSVNVPESYIRYGFVVEGDSMADADKFVAAIMENLEGAAVQGDERPKK